MTYIRHIRYFLALTMLGVSLSAFAMEGISDFAQLFNQQTLFDVACNEVSAATQSTHSHNKPLMLLGLLVVHHSWYGFINYRYQL